MTGPAPRTIDLRDVPSIAPADLLDHPLVERTDAHIRPAGVDRESLGTHRARRSTPTVESLARAS